MVDRVPTGIPEFDGLIEGGLPKGSTTLLTGLPGTGKSIFGLQYLYNGTKKGENGIYVYAESFLDSIKAQALQMGFDLEKLEQDGKIALINAPLNKKRFDLLYTIEEKKRKINAKRVVFDSLATFAINLDLFTIPLGYAGIAASTVSVKAGIDQQISDDDTASGGDSRYREIFFKSNQEKRIIYIIIETLRRLQTTNIVITFSSQSGKGITVDGVSEYVTDGIIELYNELIGAKHIRTLSVLKMRNTDHSQYIHDFEINNKGIRIKPAEQVYK